MARLRVFIQMTGQASATPVQGGMLMCYTVTTQMAAGTEFSEQAI